MPAEYCYPYGMQGSPQKKGRSSRVPGTQTDRSDAAETMRALDALLNGTLNDPFAVLGRHHTPDGYVVRAFFPGALAVEARAQDGGLLTELAPLRSTLEDVFVDLIRATDIPLIPSPRPGEQVQP